MGKALWTLGGYNFDAWLRLHHTESLASTRHPIEFGAEVSDHCYVEPRVFSFEIGVSDTAVSPTFPGGGASRSISAYQALVDLKNQRRFLTLISKYGIFNNILIKRIDAPDDWQTSTSARITVNLEEIIVVGTLITAAPKVSNTPQTTDATQRGQVNGRVLTPAETKGLNAIGAP